MFDDFVEKMWWKSAEDEAIKKAQKKAADNADDFRFSVNISLDKNNIERNPMNAASIWSFYGKEIESAFSKLPQSKQLICRLDWYILFYRALEEISQLPGALMDDKSLEFVRSLGLSAKWKERLAEYEALKEGRDSSFDAYVKNAQETLIEPVSAKWKNAAALGVARRTTRRTVKILVLTAAAISLVTYMMGIGPVARYFHHRRPQVVSKGELEDFGRYDPVKIADFNASSVLETEDGVFSDAHLMDGDPATIWAEGEEGAGIGRKLYFNIDKEAPVHYIVIYNGDQRSMLAFKKANRMRDITLKINDNRHQYHLELEDTERPQYIRVENSDVDRLWITIDSVYGGVGDDNRTCVSEVEIY